MARPKATERKRFDYLGRVRTSRTARGCSVLLASVVGRPFGKMSCSFTPHCGQSSVRRIDLIVGMVVA